MNLKWALLFCDFLFIKAVACHKLALKVAHDSNADKISFWKGGMPDSKGESKRFESADFFKYLGQASWKGRDVVYKPQQKESRIGSSQEKVHPIPIQINT